jgi:hypothetical protein
LPADASWPMDAWSVLLTSSFKIIVAYMAY